MRLCVRLSPAPSRVAKLSPDVQTSHTISLVIVRLDYPVYAGGREVAEELRRVTVRKSAPLYSFVIYVSQPEALSHTAVDTTRI